MSLFYDERTETCVFESEDETYLFSLPFEEDTFIELYNKIELQNRSLTDEIECGILDL